MRVLRQKAVARMDRIHIGDFRGRNDAIDPQVTFACLRLPNADRLIRHLYVHRIRVRLRINRHRADIQFFARPNNSDSDFATIGYKDSFKHGKKI